MRPLVLLTAFIFILHTASGQTRYQFTIVSDNDGYASINNDGYYTNGIQLAYQWRSKKPLSSLASRINIFSAGQNIYTSEFSGETFAKNLDRPITGYLYAGYHQALYTKKEHYLKWGISAGAIGKPALGQEVQTRAHRIMRIYKPTYWERELQPAYGVNADITWSPQLKTSREKPVVSFKPIITGTAGTLFTHAGAGAALVAGKFNRNSRSAFWNNHDGHTKAEREFFGFIQPLMYVKAYDATVQGGMFNDEPESMEGRLNRYFFQGKVGIVYCANKLLFGATAVYESKQSLTQNKSQYYGSLKVGILW